MAKTKGLYKRGNVWWIRYAGLDGKIRYESSGSTVHKEALDRLVDRHKAVKDGKEPIPARKIKPHMFSELADHYEKWIERQRSYECKKGFVKQLRKAFGNLPLRRFTTMLIEEYQSKATAEGKAPATPNRHITTLKHMFTKAVEWEMVEEELLKKVRRVKLLPENNRRLRYLSKEECLALVDACKPHLRPIVVTALNTGMRKQEILSLEWEKHVDLKHGFILLNVTKNGDRREIPINQTLRETLRGIVRRLDSPYVFIDEEGKRFKDVKRSFKSALKVAEIEKCSGCNYEQQKTDSMSPGSCLLCGAEMRRFGINDFRFHDLRHCFASHLIMAGVDITTIKELLGHKTLTMTLRYAHLAPSHKVKAVETLSDILGAELKYTKTIQFGGAK